MLTNEFLPHEYSYALYLFYEYDLLALSSHDSPDSFKVSSFLATTIIMVPALKIRFTCLRLECGGTTPFTCP